MGTFREEQYMFIIISGSIILKMRNISSKSCRENQNTHFMFNKFFLSCRLWGNVEKFCRAGQAIDVAHAHYMLDT